MGVNFPIYLTLLALSVAVLVDGSVRFYAIGDWGDPYFDLKQDVSDAMAEYAVDFQPEFIVGLGDNFYSNGIRSTDDPKIDIVWRQTYNQTELKDLHWYLILGNHDYGQEILGVEWNQVALTDVEPLWHVPHLWHTLSRTDNEGLTVDLVMIDTEALGERVNNHTTMMTWLNDTLTASTADWVLVVAHHPIFSCGDKGPVSGTYYNELLPVLDEHRDKIAVYLTGHDHNVQHLQFIEDPAYFDFIVSGAGGALMYAERPTYDDILLEDYSVNKTFMDVLPAFTAITATSDYLQIDFINTNSTVIYSHQRFKSVAQPSSIYDTLPRVWPF